MEAKVQLRREPMRWLCTTNEKPFEFILFAASKHLRLRPS